MGDGQAVVGVEDCRKDPKVDSQDQPRKTQKRKRGSWVFEGLSSEEKESRINGFQKEMEGLFGYYKEVMGEKVGFGLGSDLGIVDSGSVNAMVAVLMEESDLPLSRLVEEIHGRIKEKMGNLTLQAVKSAVLFVGQRMMYGVPNEDVDVLEDVTPSCLWCWEIRDAKFMQKSARGALKIRRTCRKKIHERITAVSKMITALKRSENDLTCRDDLIKASEKLSKVSKEADIRLLVHNMLKRSGPDVVEKEAKQEDKSSIKQLEKNKREAEKEKKKRDRELQKEMLQSEKEQKRLKEAAEKDEKRREKEEAEMKKQLRKQQEEAEREHRRREKEEAQVRKQLDIKRQASVMERFLKRSKTSPIQADNTSTKPVTSNPSRQKSEQVPEAVTLSMDSVLSSNDQVNADDLRKLHLSSWHHMGHSLRSNRKQCWGMRRKPKTELFKELKLTTNKGPYFGDESCIEKLVDGWGSCLTDANNSSPDVKKCIGRKQLLQFNENHRPAFYGIWPKKSEFVGPLHPWRKDPEIDYDVDSDEEWEEEEPGESLSDCDKDDEEESLEGCSKADDDESEDGFFVPDGYLSENEGVQVDGMETDVPLETKCLPSYKQDMQNEDFCLLLRQQKYLNNLTEHALRRNHPLIILNLMHEKASLLSAEDLSGTPKLEQTCLQALCIRGFPGCSPAEISVDKFQDEDREASLSNRTDSITPISTTARVSESDLPIIVSTIQSCSQSIVKLVDSLQQKFPAIPKTQLRNKVREIAEFMDNHWQVKKEILANLGMSVSPEKGGGTTKSIAAFFSKRCLPPADKDMSSIETPSPQLLKQDSATGELQVTHSQT
ncbi:hypothetical protein SLE2022_059550 [Rubroshorea leprosula]